MSRFFETPTYVNSIQELVWDPVTKKWYIPKLVIHVHDNARSKLSLINNDPEYRNKVLEYFYTKLTEKWLYSEAMYEKLLKYFKATRIGDKVEIELMPHNFERTDADKAAQEEYKFFIFKYIDNHFATRKFVKDVLEDFIYTTGANWYDLYHNNQAVKQLFAKKLKKVIKQTRLEL